MNMSWWPRSLASIAVAMDGELVAGMAHKQRSRGTCAQLTRKPSVPMTHERQERAMTDEDARAALLAEIRDEIFTIIPMFTFGSRVAVAREDVLAVLDRARNGGEQS